MHKENEYTRDEWELMKSAEDKIKNDKLQKDTSLIVIYVSVILMYAFMIFGSSYVLLRTEDIITESYMLINIIFSTALYMFILSVLDKIVYGQVKQ